MNLPKLKIGLLMESFDIPSWMYLVIEKIQKSDIAEISLIISKQPTKKKFSFENSIYKKFEDLFFSVNLDAFQNKNIQSLLETTPKINVLLNSFDDCLSFNSIDIEKINNYELDVIFITELINLEGKIFDATKFGLWSYHNELNNFDGLTGISEVFNNIPITETCLMKLNPKPQENKILYQSFSATDHHSVIRNRNNSYWKASSFLFRKLCDLYTLENRNSFLTSKYYIEKNIISKTKKDNFLRNIPQMLIRYAKSKFQNISNLEQWILFYKFENSLSTSFSSFQKILPPKDRFWADPFIIHLDNIYYIFIEEFLYSENKGHISFFTIDESGVFSKPEIILKKSYHLSYPFIFQYDNEFFMIPETSANNSIELYRCKNFPTEWVFEKNIMQNVAGIDSTIFFKNNKWWLFTNLIENNGASSWDELFLFYSDSPLSDNWIPHRKNPIISDVRSARSAGNFFKKNNSIIRPSQNSSKNYGYGLVFNEIENIDEETYDELIIQNILPDWNKLITGIHTFNHVNGLTIIDGKIKRKN